jgi:hypothetical protein
MIATISYNICGEGAQLIVVSMEGGRTIRSLQSYVESGYSGTAAVSDTTIVMSAPWLQQSVGGDRNIPQKIITSPAPKLNMRIS